MTDSNKPIGQTKTKAQGNGTPAKLKSKKNGVVYFEIATGYYYVVEAAIAMAIEDENNKLQHLLEMQIRAIREFEAIKNECLADPKNEALKNKYTALENNLFDANKNLKAGLGFLGPVVTSDDDKTKIHSLSNISGDTEKLVEVLPIRKSNGTGRVIYVRSGLNKEKWKPYIPEQSENGKGSFLNSKGIDKSELRKQLTDVSFKIKKDWDIIDPKEHTGTLFDWADKWNKAMQYQLHKEKDQSPDDHFDASFGAQLMRYTAGLGASIEFYPKQMERQGKESCNAKVAIWEKKEKTPE